MDIPLAPTGNESPPPSPPQPQESILNRKILPRGLPHSFSSNLSRDVTTPKKGAKTNNRSVRSIIASFESAASKQPPHSPVFEPITPRSSTILSSGSTGASLTSFRRLKDSQGRDRGVSECHDARNSRNGEGDEWGEERSDAGGAVEGIRSVSTPVIPRMSSIMPFAVEEEDSLTLLNYKSYFNQPLARCLDGFVDLEEGKNSSEEEKSEKKLSTKAGIDKENIPLRITKRKDRVKTASQNETQPTTSAPQPVRRQSRRPSLTHRKSSASVIALEKLMHELENFSVNPPFEEEESEIIAMAEDKPIIRRDPKEVQDYWWTVRRSLWVDEDEVYNPEAYHESNIAASSDIPKIQLPLPETTDVSARASCAFDKQIPLPAPPIPFRSPNRLSSAGRGTGKGDYSNGDTPKAVVSDLRDSLHDHIQSRGPSSSSLDVNASTSQAEWDSASEYGDEEVREQKAEDNHRRRTQPEGPSLDEIDGLFSRIPTDSAVSSPVTAVDVGGSQENTPKADSAFDQIKKRIESREEKKRSAHGRHSSLVRLSTNLESGSQQRSPQQSPKDQQLPFPQQSQPQPQEEEQEPSNRHSDSHSRRRLHHSVMNLPGLRHLRSRHSKSSLSSPDSVDSLKTPTTANSLTSISSTRATISSPVPILSAGISNPGSSIPSSIPYSATRSARSSLAYIIEPGTGRSSQDQGHKTPTDKGEEDTGMETAVGKTEASGTVVFYPMQFVTKVPKLEEAPKGGGGFRGHFRRRNKSREEGKDNMVETSILKDRNVKEFLNLHKKNSPGKEGNGSQIQNEGRNDIRQPHEEKTGKQRVGFTEGTTGITSSTSASSIPLLTTHRFGRSQGGQFQGTALDDSHSIYHTWNPSTSTSTSHTTPRPSDDHTPPTQISSLNDTPSSSYSPDKLSLNRRPTAGRRSREDHLSEIESFLNKDSFHSLQSMRSLHSQSRSLHSMHSIPESNSTGSMYSQDEEEKREDASVLIGEVLETVRSLGEEVANQANRRG
ncbi:hypothetical protein N0V85_008136 [Neurospora sp. IMI 360204]|nr:hypothetical protein N0V85_008136 [Neurospora sp. IMI 360204]